MSKKASVSKYTRLSILHFSLAFENNVSRLETQLVVAPRLLSSPLGAGRFCKSVHSFHVNGAAKYFILLQSPHIYFRLY